MSEEDDDWELPTGPPGEEYFQTLVPSPRTPEPDPAIVKVSPEVAENESEVSRSLPNRRIRTFTEVYHSEERIKFLIPDVLPDHGIVFIGGLSGTGKTILAIQLAVNLVMARPTMTWFPVEDLPQLTAMMLSLEMSSPEVQLRLQHMYPELTPEEEKILGERFVLYAEPEPIHLWEDSHCADLIRMIMRNKVNVLLLDSASVSFASDLTNQSEVNRSLQNLDTIRVRLNVCIIIVAHTRKPPPENTTNVESVSINDLFGHSGIAQHASTIFLMYEDEKTRRETIRNGTGDSTEKLVHIVSVKTRFGSSNAAFRAKLPSREMNKKGSPLLFYRNVIAAIPLSAEKRAQIKSDGTNLAEDMQGIDFGSILGEAEGDSEL